jgi:hypothetical protein
VNFLHSIGTGMLPARAGAGGSHCCCIDFVDKVLSWVWSQSFLGCLGVG